MQKTYDPLRNYVKPRDVYTHIDENTFKNLAKTIEYQAERDMKHKGHKEPILILVDDLAGSRTIHGCRFGAFAHLAVSTPHWNVTLIVITQQAVSVDPNFRDNAENLIIFPSEGQLEVDWLTRAYNSLMLMADDKKKAELLKKIVLSAWCGGRSDNSEWGKHCLVIQATPRSHSKFFIDFDREIQLGAFSRKRPRETTWDDESPPRKRPRTTIRRKPLRNPLYRDSPSR